MPDRQQEDPDQNRSGVQPDQPGQGGMQSGAADQGDGITGQGGNPGSGEGESAVDRTDAANQAGGEAQGARRASPGASSGAAGAEIGREQTGDREGRGGYGNDTGFTGGTVGSRDEGDRQ